MCFSLFHRLFYILFLVLYHFFTWLQRISSKCSFLFDLQIRLSFRSPVPPPPLHSPSIRASSQSIYSSSKRADLFYLDTQKKAYFWGGLGGGGYGCSTVTGSSGPEEEGRYTEQVTLLLYCYRTVNIHRIRRPVTASTPQL